MGSGLEEGTQRKRHTREHQAAEARQVWHPGQGHQSLQEDSRCNPKIRLDGSTRCFCCFPATGQCFNAISFVIGAVQKYDEVFANVATLMERVSAFLENLEVYLQQKLRESQAMSEKGLRTSVYRVLEHFLTILGIWRKLTTRKSAELSLAVKVVVFGEDGGVKGAMDQLETLVTQVTRAQVTQITVGLSAAAQSLQVMEERLDH